MKIIDKIKAFFGKAIQFVSNIGILEKIKKIGGKIVQMFSKIKIDYLPKIGAGLFLVGLILTWAQQMIPALAIFIAIGVIDVYLVAKKHQTISKWVHSLFPRQIDFAIMVGLLASTWWVLGAEHPGSTFVPILAGVIIGHLFWHS